MIDGNHWYLPSGEPFYSVLSQAGVERAVTLRDARKVKAGPGVTTILRIIYSYHLEEYKINQGILAALTLTRNEGEDDKSYLARVKADSKEQAKAAAEEGSRIHDAIEQSFKGHPVPIQYAPHVEAVRLKLKDLFPGIEDWISEKRFYHSSGFGGMVDLHSPSTGIVVDFKGKDGDFSDGKQLAYDQHWQLGGYSKGLELPHAPGANIFVSRTHPGMVAHKLWSVGEIMEGMEIFLSAYDLWKRLKKYDPLEGL